MKISNFLYCLFLVFYTQKGLTKNLEIVVTQKEINRFAEVMKIIKKNYIHEIEDEKAINNAINGVLLGLDHHSAYYTSEEYIDTLDKTTGLYAGLGIEVSIINGDLKIIEINKNSNIDNNGVRKGDTIIEIDNKKVKGLSISDIRRLIRGEVDTVVELKILRVTGEGVKKTLEVHLTRSMIKIENLETKNFNNNILYLKINRFSETTFDDLSAKIKSEKDISGVILDLRNNGGGLLDQAIKISDAFLSAGEIVSVKSRESDNNAKKYNASGLNLIPIKVPLVTLINNYSASASEVVAGALRDNKRTVLIGKKSFGKGSVQNIISLKDGDAIKITTALFYRPNGKMIQQQGIEPDIEVDDLIIGGIKSDSCLIKSEKDFDRNINDIDYEKKDNKNVVDDDLQLYVAKQVVNYQMGLIKK